MEMISVSMLGEFSLQVGDKRISDSDNRSKKIWLLLAYLLCHRDNPLSQQELISALWGDEPDSSNPENTLKMSFHRLRTFLDRLFPSAGQALILRRGGGYVWNNQYPLQTDYQQFARLCHRFSDAPALHIEEGLAALELYKGSFLQKLSTESWVIPISAHYHNLYLQTALGLLPLLQQQLRHEELIRLCRQVLEHEPYHEEFHRALMLSLATVGDAAGAVAVYEQLCQRLFDNFGLYPEEETRAVIHSLAEDGVEQSLPIDQVIAQLQEDSAEGALQCEYDYFKILCHAESRAIERSGRVTHIALISLGSEDPNKPLSRRSLNTAMDNLSQLIRSNLRRGDSFTRCSLSQHIVLLPQANYEDSCMVAQRIIAAFCRRHPHSPAVLHSMVLPLTSGTIHSKFQ